ncbi:hypothetical protein AGR1A_pAt20313 [Agrobacterium fabacearum CFBP 5771]|nr:hypothetical protein AGR1A_pAt20313 [Agrobacterium fabacearum CFBP 5771]
MSINIHERRLGSHNQVLSTYLEISIPSFN